MKRLILAVTAMIVLTLPGWGEGTPREQTRGGAAAHREEARNNPNRPHHRHKRHHHHRHHGAA
jgi:hypothetical protein